MVGRSLLGMCQSQTGHVVYLKEQREPAEWKSLGTTLWAEGGNDRCSREPQEIPWWHVEGTETLDETKEVGRLLIIEDCAMNDPAGFLFFFFNTDDNPW